MMRDHFRSMTERMQVQIITVDPATNRIEALTRDRAVLQLDLSLAPQAFVWPQQNEVWLVERTNISWELVCRMPTPEDTRFPTDMAPGEARIDSDNVTSRSGKKFLLAGEASNYLKFTPQTVASVPNNSIFVDSGDGKLKFKDGTGTVQALY